MYKNCFINDYKLFNSAYKIINKEKPYMSITDKQDILFTNYYNKAEAMTSGDDLLRQIALIEMLRADMQGYNMHLFIEDDQLIEFIKSTSMPSRKSTEGLFSKLLDGGNELFKLTPTEIFSDPNGTKYTCLNCNVHMHDWGFAFMIVDCRHLEKGPAPFVVYVQDEGNFTLSTNTKELFLKNGFTNKNFDKHDIEEIQFCVKLVFYLDAHPECVLDRVPKDVSAKKNKGRSVKLSPKYASIMNSKDERIRATFFRNGCPVHYTDDCYVNMKGKTGWRSGSVVNQHDADIKTAVDARSQTC